MQNISLYTKQTMDGTHGNIEGNIIVVECFFYKDKHKSRHKYEPRIAQICYSMPPPEYKPPSLSL
jgi:predicted small secreted protein